MHFRELKNNEFPPAGGQPQAVGEGGRRSLPATPHIIYTDHMYYDNDLIVDDDDDITSTSKKLPKQNYTLFELIPRAVRLGAQNRCQFLEHVSRKAIPIGCVATTA